jgi:hypothetical protein
MNDQPTDASQLGRFDLTFKFRYTHSFEQVTL